MLLGCVVLLGPASSQDWWLIKGFAVGMLLLGWCSLRANRLSVVLNAVFASYLFLVSVTLLFTQPQELPEAEMSAMQWEMMPLVFLVVGLLALGNAFTVGRHWRQRSWW